MAEPHLAQAHAAVGRDNVDGPHLAALDNRGTWHEQQVRGPCDEPHLDEHAGCKALHTLRQLDAHAERAGLRLGGRKESEPGRFDSLAVAVHDGFLNLTDLLDDALRNLHDDPQRVERRDRQERGARRDQLPKLDEFLRHDAGVRYADFRIRDSLAGRIEPGTRGDQPGDRRVARRARLVECRPGDDAPLVHVVDALVALLCLGLARGRFLQGCLRLRQARNLLGAADAQHHRSRGNPVVHVDVDGVDATRCLGGHGRLVHRLDGTVEQPFLGHRGRLHPERRESRGRGVLGRSCRPRPQPGQRQQENWPLRSYGGSPHFDHSAIRTQRPDARPPSSGSTRADRTR